MALWTNHKLVLNEVKGYGDNSKVFVKGRARGAKALRYQSLTGTGISLIGLRSTIDLGVGKHSISHDTGNCRIQAFQNGWTTSKWNINFDIYIYTGTGTIEFLVEYTKTPKMSALSMEVHL